MHAHMHAQTSTHTHAHTHALTHRLSPALSSQCVRCGGSTHSLLCLMSAHAKERRSDKRCTWHRCDVTKDSHTLSPALKQALQPLQCNLYTHIYAHVQFVYVVISIIYMRMSVHNQQHGIGLALTNRECVSVLACTYIHEHVYMNHASTQYFTGYVHTYVRGEPSRVVIWSADH